MSDWEIAPVKTKPLGALIAVRFSPSDAARLRREAGWREMSVSAYVRQAVLDRLDTGEPTKRPEY